MIQKEVFFGKSHPLYDKGIRSLSELKTELQRFGLEDIMVSGSAGTFLLVDRSFSSGSAGRTFALLEYTGIRPWSIRSFQNPDEMELQLITGQGILIGYAICLHSKYASSLRSFPVELPDRNEDSALVLAWREPWMKPYADMLFAMLQS